MGTKKNLDCIFNLLRKSQKKKIQAKKKRGEYIYMVCVYLPLIESWWGKKMSNGRNSWNLFQLTKNHIIFNTNKESVNLIYRNNI